MLTVRKTRELDAKVLLQLLKNCNQPVSEIARKVGATRQTVAKKIEQFRASGTINAFVARLDPEKFGLSTRAYVFLREDPRAKLRRRNEETIGKLHQVLEFHRLFGRYSAVLEVWTKDSRELTALVKKIHRLKGVRETETFIVHSTIKNTPEAPFVGVLKSPEKS
jgi:Lrp/AsnC family leucine-responsive transcriptional regulator